MNCLDLNAYEDKNKVMITIFQLLFGFVIQDNPITIHVKHVNTIINTNNKSKHPLLSDLLLR